MHRRSFLTGSLTTVLLAGSRIAHAQPSAGLVLSGGTVITMDPVLGDLPRGDVHVRDGAVVAVAPAIEVPGAERIDATGTIVMPGFVDTHWHMWNTLARGLPQSRLGPFAKTMGALAAVWTPQASALGVRLALAEAVNSGITTANNWAHNIKSPRICRGGTHGAASSRRARSLLLWVSAGAQARPAHGRCRSRDPQTRYFSGGDHGLIHLGVSVRGPDRSLDKVWRDGRLTRINLPELLHESHDVILALRERARL
jgi:5-methylthioadenosine/S-adenosylhomocysteine deaminase